MKKIQFFILVLVALAAATNASAQKIANAQTASVKVYGNCGMCEKKIETAAWDKGVSMADWNKETHMAQITFDSTKTSVNTILKRIAAAGYDSDQFRATDEAYDQLHECCHYERPKKEAKPAATKGLKKKNTSSN